MYYSLTAIVGIGISIIGIDDDTVEAIIEVLLPIFCLSLFLLSIDFELLLLSILFVFLFSDISIFELLLEILLLIEDLLFKGSSQFPLFSFILLSFSILLFLE
ncbi:hypothetical protein U3516DRAFT_655327 [Neocallimastix sp. 'constans']